jgi:hypothetical protein
MREEPVDFARAFQIHRRRHPFFDRSLEIIRRKGSKAILCQDGTQQIAESRVGILRPWIAHHLVQHVDHPRPFAVHHCFVRAGSL